jgi:hypothetical protein
MTNTAKNSTLEKSTSRGPDGPHPGALGIVVLVLTILGLLAQPLLANGHVFISPLGSTAQVANFYRSYPAAETVSGLFLFVSATPLGIYSATTYSRLRRLGVRVPGPAIGLYGGITASIFVAATGLITWVIGQPIGNLPAPFIHAAAYLIYVFGGVGFVGGLGLLLAGIAVPTLILRLAPRWLAWTGLVLAAVSELSFLNLLSPEFGLTLPIGRFLGVAWLLVIGFLLPRNMQDVHASKSRASAIN